MIETTSGLEVANGFTRIVHGGRGDYVEFLPEQILMANLHVPSQERWRLNSGVAYYNEYRSNDLAYVKFYRQKRAVKYADYKIGMWYASPSELLGIEPTKHRGK
jgi:hypothetical protein